MLRVGVVVDVDIIEVVVIVVVMVFSMVLVVVESGGLLRQPAVMSRARDRI